MKKINLDNIIQKIASLRGPGALNRLTAARVGKENFDFKEAAELIGKTRYVKAAEFKKIREGLEALAKIKGR